MIRTTDCDHVISQGTLRNGSASVDYYTTMPTPSQWIAVGVMRGSDAEQQPVGRRRKLIVGSGTSEVSAIADLHTHFVDVLQERREVDAARRASRRSSVVPGDSMQPDVEYAGEQESPSIYH